MNMIEVDPQLFIKCRLCLEEMGMYQILPRIQQQIKYCFDIDVEPYDGLPQLLCKKCESILSEYFARKKNFVEKQQSLKKQALPKTENTVSCIEEPQQEAVSSSQLTENENELSFKDGREDVNVKAKVVSVSHTDCKIGKAKSKEVSVSRADCKIGKGKSKELSVSRIDCEVGKAKSKEISVSQADIVVENVQSKEVPLSQTDYEIDKVKPKQVPTSESNEVEKAKSKQSSMAECDVEKVAFKQVTSRENNSEGKFSSKEIAPLKTTIKLIKNLESKKRFNEDNKSNSNSHLQVEKIRSLWKNGYNKQYICRICEIQLRKKNNIKKHVATHDLWLNDYRDIFKTHCTVVLQKIDSKPNVTQVPNTVVYDRDRIILDEGNPQYYVNYVSKTSSEANHTKKDIEKRIAKRSSYGDSSDDDITIKRNKRKRRRLLSRSSNETVVIEGNNNRSPVSYTKRDWSSGLTDKAETGKSIDTECINIDDTSTDSSSYKYNINSQNDVQTSQANIADQKTIQNIISMCHNKYLKRFDSSDSNVAKKKSLKYCLNTESQLKHKVLSLGRKNINKQGFNSMGLLRYLESKNLDIHWIPTLNISNNKESSYVRILTKLRGCDENSNEIGWKKVPENLLQKDIVEEKSNDTLYDSNLFVDITIDANVSQTTETKEKETESKHSEQTVAHGTKVDGHTVLNNSGNNESDSILKNKLLNANPVPNPKQLPKKSNVIETKLHATKTTNEVVVSQNNPKVDVDSDNSILIDLDEEISDSQMPMPIITSTTSLALTTLKKEKESNDHDYEDKSAISNNATNTDTTEISESNHQEAINTEKPTSWLKVKPVSELLSERVLNNLNQQSQTISNQTLVSNNLWTLGQSQNVVYQNVTNNSQQSQNTSQPAQRIQFISYPADNMASAPQNVAPPVTSVANREYVVLDTVDLPNTKTDSPFTYFKKLLQIHGIILLEMNEPITPDFNCLIKFKLVFHQEMTQQAPVVLCLSLLCDKNRFCLKVKDPNQEDVEVNKISANWQWEILKAYKGDVVPKLLQNAQRVSQEVFEHTKKLLCLLKSINLKSSITA